MNVFISSVVSNFEHYRAAAKKAVSLLGHTPVMCEDFGARPYSSEVACMTEVDQADVVVLSRGKGGWFQLGIYGISHQVYAEPPTTPASSMSMPHRSEKNIEERKLLIPASQGIFNQWLEDASFRIERKLS